MEDVILFVNKHILLLMASDSQDDSILSDFFYTFVCIFALLNKQVYTLISNSL